MEMAGSQGRPPGTRAVILQRFPGQPLPSQSRNRYTVLGNDPRESGQTQNHHTGVDSHLVGRRHDSHRLQKQSPGRWEIHQSFIGIFTDYVYNLDNTACLEVRFVNTDTVRGFYSSRANTVVSLVASSNPLTVTQSNCWLKPQSDPLLVILCRLWHLHNREIIITEFKHRNVCRMLVKIEHQSMNIFI